MAETKGQTCEERINEEMASRLDDLRRLYDAQGPQECETCEGLGEVDEDCPECAGTGRMGYAERGEIGVRCCDGCDATGSVLAECPDCEGAGEIEDDLSDIGERHEYGLSWDYIRAEDAPDDEPFFCYLLSYGGPQEELRFYPRGDGELYKVTFAFRDWFDGATRTLRGDDRALGDIIWQDFRGMGMTEIPDLE